MRCMGLFQKMSCSSSLFVLLVLVQSPNDVVGFLPLWTRTNQVQAFVTSSPPIQQQQQQRRRRPWNSKSCYPSPLPSSSSTSSALWASRNLPDDPFQILNIDPSPTLDKKTIKRAYKRMALKYHPDVVTNPNSSAQDKKQANDNFAKINAAYATLMGKNNSDSPTSSSNGSSTSGAASGGGYTPPHRRTSSYNNAKTSSSGTSTDWQDYMPKYDEEQYDANGDSFGSIFSDLLMGAAGAAAASGTSAAGGGGIFRDFVEFLESNIDGYDSSSSSSSTNNKNKEDTELRILLQTGTLQEVKDEMEDTELIVQQLNAKSENLQHELEKIQADLEISTRFVETMELDETLEEVQARQKVVLGYKKKAQTRLLKLQTRYRDLMVADPKEEDSTTSSRRRNTSSSSSSSSSSGNGDTPGYSSSSRYDGNQSSDTTSSSATSSGDEDESSSWKREGFGSSGRGRGSSRGSSRGRRSSSNSSRRETTRTTPSSSSSRSTTTTSNSGSPPPSTSPASSNQNYNTSRGTSTDSSSSSSRTSNSRRTSSSSSTPTTWKPPVPPHRRTSSYESQVQEDKRRLREIQVDDEFEKLKKDLGL